MTTRRSIQLANIFGIRISVGLSWFLVLFLYIFLFTPEFHEMLGGSYGTAYLLTVASVLSFFASLLAHELGHALVARRNGLQVLGVELWALGGLTRTDGIAETPGVQFRVSGAGPAVTALIIGLCVLGGTLSSHGQQYLTLAAAERGAHSTPLAVWLGWMIALNTLVLMLNLLPAAPLDGAQMAHAVIWKLTGSRNSAARISGRIGQGSAIALGLGGVYLLTQNAPIGFFLAMLAMFLYQSAGAAALQGAIGQRIQRLRIADIIDREPLVVPGELRLLDAQEQFFNDRRSPWLAVVDQARRFIGVVRAERLEREIAAGRPALAVKDVVEGMGDLPVQVDESASVESLMHSEALGRWGGIVAVDSEGVLRGIVTVGNIRKALRAAGSTR